MNGKKWACFFAACGIFICALLLRWPDPAGPNGYFYLKNIQELSAFRGFYFHDYSLALLFPAALNLFARNPHLSWALAAGLTLAAMPIALSFLAIGLASPSSGTGRKPGLLPLFLLLFVLCQYPLLELALVYYKNSFALTASLVSLACAAWAMRLEQEGHRRCLFAATLGWGILAVFSHKTMLFWLFACGGIFLLPSASRALRHPLVRLAGFGALVASLVAAGVFYRRLGSQLVGSLSLDASPYPFWFWIRHNLELEPAFTVPTLIAFVCWLYLGGKAARNARGYGISFLLWSLILALDFHPWQEPGSNGLHYRLWLLLPVVPACFAAQVYLRAGRGGRALFSAALASLLLWEAGDMRENFAEDFPAYAALAEDVKQIPRFVGAQDRLLCRHGLEFFVDYVTGLRCRSFIDHELRPHTWRVAYLADISSRAALADLRGRAVLGIGRDYALIPEGEWRVLAARHRLRPSSGNPMEERPAFIHDQEQ